MEQEQQYLASMGHYIRKLKDFLNKVAVMTSRQDLRGSFK